jgi:hypothetical protein
MMTKVEQKDFVEGELSYHARVVEGGAAAFIAPSTGEVFLIDQGRIVKRESFYRNSLGETYKRGEGRNWDKFEISENTGGQQNLTLLRKSYMGNKMPNMIIQER